MAYQGKHATSQTGADEKPSKKKKSTLIILWIILIVALLGVAASGFLLIWNLVVLPNQNRALYSELDSAQQTTSQTTQNTRLTFPTIDFASLRTINSDIVGWITIPNTVIDYPVLQAAESNPDFYLYHNYKGEETKYGSIFLASEASIHLGDPNARCWTIYGHNMNDGQMFAAILNYADLDFYRSSPVFRMDTDEDTGLWEIISVFKTNVEESQGDIFYYTRSSFADDTDFLNFVNDVEVRSVIHTGIPVNETDQLMVLSTCSYEYDNFRTVVVARRMRAGESIASIDATTAQASYAVDPLYPDCWYRNGGTKPTYPTSFAEARQQGLATWYDGTRA